MVKLQEYQIILELNNMIEYNDDDVDFVYDNFSFSELLFSFKSGIFSKIFLERYFNKKSYLGNIEDNLYKMSFFEDENSSIIFKRSLYLHLKRLFDICKNEEKLKYEIDYVCEYFKYPKEIKNLIYYMPYERKENDNKKWILSDRLSDYLNEYKEILKLPDYNMLDRLKELYNNNFALISSGNYKNFFISCNKNNEISLDIWPSYIIQNKSSYKLDFDNVNELINFINDNNINIYKCINNDFFMEEEKYIYDFKEIFNKVINDS